MEEEVYLFRTHKYGKPTYFLYGGHKCMNCEKIINEGVANIRFCNDSNNVEGGIHVFCCPKCMKEKPVFSSVRAANVAFVTHTLKSDFVRVPSDSLSLRDSNLTHIEVATRNLQGEKTDDSKVKLAYTGGGSDKLPDGSKDRVLLKDESTSKQFFVPKEVKERIEYLDNSDGMDLLKDLEKEVEENEREVTGYVK